MFTVKLFHACKVEKGFSSKKQPLTDITSHLALHVGADSDFFLPVLIEALLSI